MIPAIQTKVKGRNYRSLLEAKWATFFGLCGWDFEYEPFETNGWIPDFLIRGKTKPILVEVKPFTVLKEWEENMIPKIQSSLIGNPYFGKEILLLGVSPFKSTSYYNIGFIGELFWEYEHGSTTYQGEEPKEKGHYSFFNAPLTWHDNKYGFSNDEMSYVDRITDYYDGNVEAADIEDGERLWADACNRVQWNRK